MNAVVGLGAVLLGFLAAIGGLVTVVAGLVKGRPVLLRTGRVYAWLVLAGAVIAVIAMQRALLTHDFSLQYVAENNARSTPVLYSITGMWSALEGSILLWALVLAGYLAVMVRHFRDRATDPLVGWATATAFVVVIFFFGLMLGPANPFRELAGAIPADGRGPNPLLQQHVLVAFHPPMLYRSRSPSPRWSPAAWARDGWWRRGGGRCSPGASSLPGSCSARGGRTRYWAGAASGRGTRWRTPPSCRGSPPPRSCTR
jgi:cytochrome c-type biogenesis protein CcmF